VDAAQHPLARIGMKPNFLCRHCFLPLRDLAGRSLFDHSHDVALLRDDEILAVDFDLGSRPLPEQHSVADFDIERAQFAVIAPGAGGGDNDFAFHWLSLAVSGMIIPPAVFSSSSIRRMRTRSCNGRNFIGLLPDFSSISNARLAPCARDW